MAALPPDLDTVIERAWQLTQRTPGFLGESESRFLGMLAACVPARGTRDRASLYAIFVIP